MTKADKLKQQIEELQNEVIGLKLLLRASEQKNIGLVNRAMRAESELYRMQKGA